MAADSGNQGDKHIAHQIGNMLLCMLEEKNSQITRKKREGEKKRERTLASYKEIL